MRPVEYGSLNLQLEWIFRAYRNAIDFCELDSQTAVLRRFFCGDLSNQVAALEAHPFSNPHNTDEPCAVSWVRQPPLPPAKVALWAYHVKDPSNGLSKLREGNSLTLGRREILHHWTTGLTCLNSETSYDQTTGILEKYEAFLQARGLCLADNVLRTWFFVQNIDANYPGFVAARRDFFAQRGLTPDTHFIASTGIEGSYKHATAKVSMDAYAISGVRPEQIEFLSAPDHFCPSHIYGVSFERGTSVAYRDRKQVIISGTA
ncbi:MAG: translation initiation inhibitor, partial [bacterium]